MVSCLSASLTADAVACLLTYCKEYTFDGVEYASLLTMQLPPNSPRQPEQLGDLCVNGDINKIHGEFDKILSQLVHLGATFDNPIDILFEAYSGMPWYHFKKYISRQNKDYLDGILGSTFNHELLLTRAMKKYDYLRTKGMWGAKSPDNERIVAMSTALNDLKGKLTR